MPPRLCLVGLVGAALTALAACGTDSITSSSDRATIAANRVTGGATAYYQYLLEGTDIAMASNGDRVELTGDGQFALHPKSVSGGGNFTHKAPDGSVRATGTWTASELLSFNSYGTSSPPLPPDFEGGLALIRVHLEPDGGGAGVDAVLEIDCLIGSPPPSAQEGVRLAVQGGPNFNKQQEGGTTLFIRAAFDFALDRFEVIGNIPGGFVDDFDDGLITAGPTAQFLCLGNTVTTEAGGFLMLTSDDGARTIPGFLLDHCLLGLETGTTRLRNGNGDATVTAVFRADAPQPRQGYGVQVFTLGVSGGLVNIQVHNGGAESLLFPVVIRPGGKQQTGAPVPVNLTGVDRIFLRLNLDDATNRVSASFSIDGGSTFTAVTLPAEGDVFVGSSEAVASAFGFVAVQ